MNPAEFIILHVDDDPDDRMLVKDALVQNGTRAQLDTAEDGEQLMGYLRSRNHDSGLPMPTLILLDLNMPRKDGREALCELKSDPRLKHIPVVVMTTSGADEDVQRSYKLGVNSFIIKPSSFTQLVDVLRKLTVYWFETVKLPPEKGDHT